MIVQTMHFHVDTRAMGPEQLVELVEQAPIGICLFAAPHLRITAANQEYAALAGAATGADLVGTAPDEHPSASLTRQLLPVCRWALETQTGLPGVEVQALAGGIPRSYTVHCVPLKHEDGSACAVLATVLDITEHKRSEDALREARRLAEDAWRREHHIATRFQSVLLPVKGVRVPGCAIAHTYRPALVEADVGGDFYNFFPMEGGRVGLVVGDVGGKGLEAALIAARVQHAVVALAAVERGDPASVLDGVRRVVASLQDSDLLVTLFFGVLHPASGRLSYAAAGHEPPLLWQHALGHAKPLPADGPPLCDIDAPPHHTRHAVMALDDLLFLYTDGLPEARAPAGGSFLGIEPVKAILAAHHQEEPAALVEAAYRAAWAHSAGRLRDDIALVAVRRLDRDQPAPEPVFVDP